MNWYEVTIKTTEGYRTVTIRAQNIGRANAFAKGMIRNNETIVGIFDEKHIEAQT